MAIKKHRQLVQEHTERNGRGSHYETGPEGMRREITYALFDCKHCGEEAIASKVDFDTWAEVWPSVESHLRAEHPEELSKHHN